MIATQQLYELGQSLWLDNITRPLLTSGTLQRYIDELSITGLTSNPTIFDHAIGNSAAYDAVIREKLQHGESPEPLFFELALDDITRAADLFRPVYDRTSGVDGWVSLEVSPLLAHDASKTVASAKELSVRANRPNLFIKIPGTKEGLPAIEESILTGIPVNVTLLFSRSQYVGRRGGIPARCGTANRCRIESERPFRRVRIRQPVGHRRGRKSTGEASQSARHRNRGEYLP